MCFTFASFTGNLYIGILLSVLTCALFMLAIAYFTEKTRSQPFVIGLAVNLFSAGFINLFSSYWFDTKGTLFGLQSDGGVFFARTGTTILSYAIVTLIFFALQTTTWGLRTRVTGTDWMLLQERGIRVKNYRIISWVLPAALAAFAGCILVMRLQAFVPNVSSGKGWLALVAVFFGKKKTLPTLLAAVFFATISYATNRLQAFQLVPHTVLLAFPYFVALLLCVMPQIKNKGLKQTV